MWIHDVTLLFSLITDRTSSEKSFGCGDVYLTRISGLISETAVAVAEWHVSVQFYHLRNRTQEMSHKLIHHSGCQ